MAEPVDATDLKSVGLTAREGSSPSPGTIIESSASNMVFRILPALQCMEGLFMY